MNYSATYKPSAGEHIAQACHEAVKQAVRRGRNVAMTFNDVTLVASPRRKPQSMVNYFWQQMQPKGPRHPSTVHAEREAQRKSDAAVHEVDLLVDILPAAIATGELDALIVWVRNFTPQADQVKLGRLCCDELYQQLQAAGYSEGENVGQPSEWFTTRERIGRWIVGQVMNAFKRGHGPHPMFGEHFCGKYFELLA